MFTAGKAKWSLDAKYGARVRAQNRLKRMMALNGQDARWVLSRIWLLRRSQHSLLIARKRLKKMKEIPSSKSELISPGTFDYCGKGESNPCS
jgi:hypothetical protein